MLSSDCHVVLSVVRNIDDYEGRFHGKYWFPEWRGWGDSDDVTDRNILLRGTVPSEGDCGVERWVNVGCPR